MWNQVESGFGDAAGTVAVFGGRTGTCRQYAEWIAERRDVELLPLQEAKLSKIKGFRTIIYILPVYDGQLEGLDSLVRNYPKLMKVTRSYADDMGGAEGEKRIYVLAVGLSEERDAFSSGALNLPSVLDEVPVFYAMGRYLPENADARTTLRLDILEKAMEKDPETVPAWFRSYHKGADESGRLDRTDPAFLDPILDGIDGR